MATSIGTAMIGQMKELRPRNHQTGKATKRTTSGQVTGSLLVLFTAAPRSIGDRRWPIRLAVMPPPSGLLQPRSRGLNPAAG